MPQTLSNPLRKRGRHRVSVSLAESKTLKLYQEGRRLLARADFEDISMARFAKAADTSVGAFYVRFADKDAFLDFVTSHTFASARRGFDESLASLAASKKPAELLSNAMIAQFAAKEFAGIVRLAVKRGLSDLKQRRAFDAYREHIIDQVVSLLPDEAARESETKFEVAIQAAFGILTDRIVSTPRSDPLKLSEYHGTILGLFSKPFGTLRLVTPNADKADEQSGVKKI